MDLSSIPQAKRARECATEGPRLLVSVRTVEEATVALAGGAALIDLKEPRNGALGAVQPAVARAVCDYVDSAASSEWELPMLSLAMGELSDADVSGFSSVLLERFSFAKLGLAGCAELDWKPLWVKWAQRLPLNVQPVFVIYADWQLAGSPSPKESLNFFREFFGQSHQTSSGNSRSPCGGVLIDTWEKASGDLFDLLTAQQIEEIVVAAKSIGAWTALAGSINAQTVSQAVFMKPDIVAVRGAVCDGARTDSIDLRHVLDFGRRLRSLTASPQ